jgi:SSS family solute:Na+ symporter
MLRPKASEGELVLVGRLTTWGFGAAAILMALFYSSWRDLGVFTLMMNFSALVATPYAVPLFWCLLIRRSPDWAAWSTVAALLRVGLLVSLVPGSTWATQLPAEGIGAWMAWARSNHYTAITIANVSLGSLWFLGASAWRGRVGRSGAPDRGAGFFSAIHTDISRQETRPPDHRRHRGIARMCLIYVGFVFVLAVFAQVCPARLGLLFCAVFMGAVGGGIALAARRGLARQEPLPASDSPYR